MIREINQSDFDGLMMLYTHLHSNKIPEHIDKFLSVRNEILGDRNHHIIVAEEDGRIVSSCVCMIVPNLTHDQRPYALIENVVTDKAYRNRGLATACLNYARDIALSQNCYKIMLMTGSKEESTLNFYRRAGFNSEDKTAFIQWI